MKKMMMGGMGIWLILMGMKVGAVTNLGTAEFGGGEVTAGGEISSRWISVTNVNSTLSGTGSKIVVKIPASVTVGTFENGDVVFTISGANVANLAGGLVSFDSDQNEVSLILDADDEVAVSDVVQVSFPENGATAFMTAPEGASQLGFGMRMEEVDGTVSKTGMALLGVGNDVEVNLEVADSLVLTVNGSNVSIAADSQVNEGIGTGRAILNVASNGWDGFLVKADLEGTGGVQDALVGANTGRVFTAAIDDGDDWFSFDASEDGIFLSGGTGVTDQIFSGSTTVFQSAGAGGALVNTGAVTVDFEMNVSENTRGDIYEGTVTFTIYPAF